MSSDAAGLDDLNAYIDGELPPERTADVADLVAREPDVARSVAALTRLRSVLIQSTEMPPVALPIGAARRVRARRRVALALGIALGVSVVVLLLRGVAAS
jgi:anti-sigma factor RsiW